ncbi:unnamed protein product [Paramecium primaurelia]|uniref:Uncharacterized protein n=1 Tax=Paramecium primaurelia TaxID=5886 RepID=A0A8S1JYV1_PARPR|nr:unnamed protein product [Paramecium primaurelia]
MDFDRKHILLNEFRKINIDLDQPISENVIFQFLDEKSHGTFDNSIALQLHQQVIQHYQKLTINNFINVYLQAETILNNKIDKARIEIQNLTMTKQQSSQALLNIKKQEQLNKYGIMEDSILMINHVHAVVNKLSLSMKVFILMSSSTTSFQTPSQNELDWNDSYEFPIENGSEVINVHVKAYQGNTTIDIGQATYAVQQFNSQAQTNVEAKLQCVKPYSGVVILSGLWVFSKTKYFSDLISELDTQIQQLKSDLMDFENDLQTLQAVFPNTLISNSDANHNIYQSSPEKQIDNIGNIEQKTLNKYLVAIMALLITLSSLDRCCYLDILIILVYSINFKNQTLDAKLLKQISVATFVSFTLDIVWVVIYVVPLWSEIDTPDMGIQKIIVVTGVLLFITKLPFSFLCAYLSKQAQEIIPEFQVKVDENDLSGLQPLEYQNISRNESLSSYQQYK